MTSYLYVFIYRKKYWFRISYMLVWGNTPISRTVVPSRRFWSKREKVAVPKYNISGGEELQLYDWLPDMAHLAECLVWSSVCQTFTQWLSHIYIFSNVARTDGHVTRKQGTPRGPYLDCDLKAGKSHRKKRPGTDPELYNITGRGRGDT